MELSIAEARAAQATIGYRIVGNPIFLALLCDPHVSAGGRAGVPLMFPRRSVTSDNEDAFTQRSSGKDRQWTVGSLDRDASRHARSRTPRAPDSGDDLAGVYPALKYRIASGGRRLEERPVGDGARPCGFEESRL